MALSYRSDIDGLRALAVMAVVLFHAELGAFGGGYVGVDIFFVISGYLITSIIADQLSRGQFSFITFYANRMRRIFPALFFMLIAAFFAAFIVFSPRDFKDFGESLFSAALFVSNVFFWTKFDYFDGPAYMKPLLHTWSLSVEEQFYVFFPALLFAIYRFRTVLHPGRAVLVLLAFSLAGSIYVTAPHSTTAFYLAHLRAWELFCGSILALGGVPEISRRSTAEGVAIVGLGLIGFAVFFYSKLTRFPGASALIPCLGAMFIIHGGARYSTAVSRLLSQKSVVFVGLISYSLYLWHWPILVFGRYLNLRSLSIAQTSIALALIVLISIVSWWFIERPFRRRQILVYQGALLGTGVAVSIVACVLGLSIHFSDGLPSRVSPAARSLEEEARNDYNLDRDRCLGGDSNPIAFEDKCVLGTKNVAPSIAVWGDSFAEEVVVALGREAELRHMAVINIGYSACPPAVFASPETSCNAYNKQILSKLQLSKTVKKIILIARYSYYLQGWEGPFLDGFNEVVNALVKSGKDVIVTYPIPEPPGFVPNILARFVMSGRPLDDAFTDRARYEHENAGIIKYLDGIVTRPRISAARIQDIICGSRRCKLSSNGRSLYFDSNHLSVTGAIFVRPAFDSVFEEQDKIAPARAER